jgi:hypothetical protein
VRQADDDVDPEPCILDEVRERFVERVVHGAADERGANGLMA